MSKTPVTAVIGEVRYVVTLSDGTHGWLAAEPLESGGGNRGPRNLAGVSRRPRP